MVRRLPACNPCRASKVSCDHARPVCQRCKEKNDAHACVYRSRPFKHNRALDTDNGNQTNTRIPENVPGTSKTLRHYPNPGYLGTSSHITLFEQLPSVRDTDGDISYTPLDTSSHFNEALNGQATTEKVEQGAALIKRLRADLNHRKCESLVLAWIETGINLPIAEPYTVACAAAAQNVLFAFSTTSEDDISSSKTLLNESVRPLNLDRDGTIEDFSRMFAAGSPRWETLGLYFTSISRATIDLVRFPRLFSSPGQRRALQESAMQCSDLCLDIALSIDCMNDLQLMLQYENFILHSLVDGDQSTFLSTFMWSY